MLISEETKEVKRELNERLKKAKEALSEAKLLFRLNNQQEGIIRLYHAVYHSARVLLFTKGIGACDYAEVVRQFGLHFVQSGIIEKNRVRPALVFAEMYNNKELNIINKPFMMEILKSADYLVKTSTKISKKIIKEL